jgi:hypothetical protein
MLKDAPTFAIVGVDAAENEHFKVSECRPAIADRPQFLQIRVRASEKSVRYLNAFQVRGSSVGIPKTALVIQVQMWHRHARHQCLRVNLRG